MERGSWLGWIILQTPLALFAQKRFICLNRDVWCYFRPCGCSLKPLASIPQRYRFLRLLLHLPVLDGCIGGDRASQVALGNYAVAAELSPVFLLITMGPTYCWLFDVFLHNALVCISLACGGTVSFHRAYCCHHVRIFGAFLGMKKVVCRAISPLTPKLGCHLPVFTSVVKLPWISTFFICLPSAACSYQGQYFKSSFSHWCRGEQGYPETMIIKMIQM